MVPPLGVLYPLVFSSHSVCQVRFFVRDIMQKAALKITQLLWYSAGPLVSRADQRAMMRIVSSSFQPLLTTLLWYFIQYIGHDLPLPDNDYIHYFIIIRLARISLKGTFFFSWIFPFDKFPKMRLLKPLQTIIMIIT